MFMLSVVLGLEMGEGCIAGVCSCPRKVDRNIVTDLVLPCYPMLLWFLALSTYDFSPPFRM